MIEVVIRYNESRQEFVIYEPTTDTMMVGSNLTECLGNLSKLLMEMSGLNLLDNSEVSYHIDSYTMKTMITSNVDLLKQLKSGPSGFTRSQQKFGGGTSANSIDCNKSTKKKKYNSGFQGAKGFSNAYKKFGGKGF